MPETKTLSPKGLSLVISFEVSSPEYYTKALSHPTWPGLNSGITIGIGYDVSFDTIPELLTHWSILPWVKYLIPALGVRGTAAKALLSNYSQYSVSWDQALSVFQKYTIPDYFTKTESIFPLSKLPFDFSSALWSLVYNRGTSLEGDSRKEMKDISIATHSFDKDLLTLPELKVRVAKDIRAMKRLWLNVPGLQNRREAEARLVENS